MSPQEAIQRRLERIRSEEDLGLAIEMLADVCSDLDSISSQERIKLLGQVTMLREIIVGNGHPSSSVVARLETLESNYKDTCDKVTEIHETLLGNLPKGSKTSILNRIEEVENVANVIKKLAWLITTLFVSDILFRLVWPLINP